jgi:hypothetical protein
VTKYLRYPFLFLVGYFIVSFVYTQPILTNPALSLVKHLMAGYRIHGLHSNLISSLNLLYFFKYTRTVRYIGYYMRLGVLCTAKFLNRILGVQFARWYPICTQTSCFRIQCMRVYPKTNAPGTPFAHRPAAFVSNVCECTLRWMHQVLHLHTDQLLSYPMYASVP